MLIPTFQTRITERSVSVTALRRGNTTRGFKPKQTLIPKKRNYAKEIKTATERAVFRVNEVLLTRRKMSSRAAISGNLECHVSLLNTVFSYAFSALEESLSLPLICRENLSPSFSIVLS